MNAKPRTTDDGRRTDPRQNRTGCRALHAIALVPRAFSEPFLPPQRERFPLGPVPPPRRRLTPFLSGWETAALLEREQKPQNVHRVQRLRPVAGMRPRRGSWPPWALSANGKRKPGSRRPRCSFRPLKGWMIAEAVTSGHAMELPPKKRPTGYHPLVVGTGEMVRSWAVKIRPSVRHPRHAIVTRLSTVHDLILLWPVRTKAAVHDAKHRSHPDDPYR